MTIGIIALFTGKTAEIITISVFGALTLYAISMVSVIKLRRAEPLLERPFKVPFYPLFPIIALVIAVGAFIAMTFFNQMLAIIYISIILTCFVAFKIHEKRK
jgi:ethanolamine permease